MILTQIFLLVFCTVGIKNWVSCKKSLSSRFTYYLDGDSIDWPSRSIKNVYAGSGRFQPRNIIPTRFQTKAHEAVIAFPRLRTGVPITLGKICLKYGQNRPDIKPFPSWELQEEGNSDAIQNAVDIFLDAHNTVWVLDTGVVNSLDAPLMRACPKVFGIDFRTGKVLHKIDLTHLCSPTCRLQHIVADTSSMGRTFLYISDAESSSVFVWDVTENRGTCVSLPMLEGRRDILYMFLIRIKHGENLLGLSYLSGSNIYCIKTSCLQEGESGRLIDLGPKPARMVVLGTDNGSLVFFRYKNEPKIFSWDVQTPLGISNFFEIDKGSDCRLSTQVSGGSRLLMWSLDSNFQDFVNGIAGSIGASAAIHPLATED